MGVAYRRAFWLQSRHSPRVKDEPPPGLWNSSVAFLRNKDNSAEQIANSWGLANGKQMKLAVEVAGKTDVGCVRTNNEDNFGWDARYGIFVVCDGMGGQAAGEVASKMAVDEMLKYFREAPGQAPEDSSEDSDSPKADDPAREDDPAKGTNHAEGRDSAGAAKSGSAALEIAIDRANRSIYKAAHQDDSHSGMGTTIVAALVDGNKLVIGHVGDSRIYLIRRGDIEQLTQDHSLVMEQVRLGYLTAEQAETSELQNVILRALGSDAEVQSDVDEQFILTGDVLLMTSDGLTRHVRDQEILKIVEESPSLEAACSELIQTAKDRGGQDNITCLLLRLVERPWYKEIFNSLFAGGPQWQNSI
jgi:serine/threonine protein phosphatase PrpC